ncbi:hypothetical protein OG21DRAFT_1479679 [Imleria badia]|nr:hypothetical protein OG21DRAFT_1479679 [Imleria badia]
MKRRSVRPSRTTESERSAINWIITTSGTRFGVRDGTPEAISLLIERHALGIVHLLLSASVKHTPFAALSRPIAGTIKNTLVVTLPASVKAVRENMEVLLSGGVVAHAIDLIKGGSGKQVHAALGTSHTPSGQASNTPDHHFPGRHRILSYPQISLEAALQLILSEIQPLGPVELPVTPALAGHVLVEDVYAPQNVPSSQTTNVDGYALRCGPLPAGTDTVIDTELVSTVKDAKGDLEERQVKALVQVPTGENVRLPGSDVRIGDLVLQKDDMITSLGGEIGTLAFVGRKEVKVRRKPVVALLSTASTHVRAITKGLHEADLLLTTGGTSMGSSDPLKPLRVWHGYARKRRRLAGLHGHATKVNRAVGPSLDDGERKFLFALPENPASALVTFHVFVVDGWWRGIQSTMRLDPRVEFHRVVVKATPEGLKPYSTGGQRSSQVASLSGANALVQLPILQAHQTYKLGNRNQETFVCSGVDSGGLDETGKLSSSMKMGLTSSPTLLGMRTEPSMIAGKPTPMKQRIIS